MRYQFQILLLKIFILLIFASCKAKDKSVKINYYENGKIQSIKRYHNEKIHGQAQWFFSNGNIEQTVLFQNGIENGSAYYFYESGRVKYYREWISGKIVRYAYDFYDNNLLTIQAVLLYNDFGEFIYRKVFDINGNVIIEQGIKPDNFKDLFDVLNKGVLK